MGAYSPPSGATDPNASYVGKNTAAGQQGSRVPRYAVEMPQREIANAIAHFGLSPTNADMTQLGQAIERAVASGARIFFGVDAGPTANTLVIPATIPDIAAVADGDIFVLIPARTNTAVDVAVQLAGKGTYPILTASGAKPAPGDLVAAPQLLVAYQGALRFASFTRSEIGSFAAVFPAVLALTQAGAKFSSAFTAGNPISNFPGGAIGTTGLPNPYTLAQSLTVNGATYIDATGIVGFRATDSTGSDCRTRLIATGGGLPSIRIGDYLGCRTVNYNQIPTQVGLVLQGLDPTQPVNLQLIIDRTETAGAVQVYDPRISAQHNGTV